MSDRPPFADLVDLAAEESAQALFSPAAEAAPVAQLDELLAALQGPALRAVLEARVEQITRYGHDAAEDARRGTLSVPHLARDTLSEAITVLHQAAVLQPGSAQAATHLKVARRKLVRGAALALAAIQRLDLEMEKQADG